MYYYLSWEKINLSLKKNHIEFITEQRTGCEHKDKSGI